MQRVLEGAPAVHFEIANPPIILYSSSLLPDLAASPRTKGGPLNRAFPTPPKGGQQ